VNTVLRKAQSTFKCELTLLCLMHKNADSHRFSGYVKLQSIMKGVSFTGKNLVKYL